MEVPALEIDVSMKICRSHTLTYNTNSYFLGILPVHNFTCGFWFGFGFFLTLEKRKEVFSGLLLVR